MRTQDMEPTHYTRDPHKLIAYLIPLPAPSIPVRVPIRFLTYTPPPPPLQKPRKGESESWGHKRKRKWQTRVRLVKQSPAKGGWKTIRNKATENTAQSMYKVTSTDLDFMKRVQRNPGLEEIVLVYPDSLQARSKQVEEEFIGSMMWTKRKAQKIAFRAASLLPVRIAIYLVPIAVAVVLPVVGVTLYTTQLSLLTGDIIDANGVGTYISIRGAKTARRVTKRLASTSDELRLRFVPSSGMKVLKAYLATRCSEHYPELFALDEAMGLKPTESEVLKAIGWTPSGDTGRKIQLWEAKEDLKATFDKAAKEWAKWCKAFEKNPEKALKE